MRKKSNIFSVIMITLGIALFIYRSNLPEQISPEGYVYDNLGAITAGCISIFIGITTFISTTIISKIKNKGAYYVQES